MKKFLRKTISGLLVFLTAITLIGCGKPITETEASSIETTEEITTTEETIEETTEETTEETIKEETTKETPEETPEPEKYFTYKAKYVEEYPRALLITDESFPGDLRVSLSDGLPESFFEKRDCKSSEECFNQVIEGILDSLEGKEIILRDTQRGLPQFSVVDTTKPLELVFKFVQTKEEETGPLYLPLWDEEGILYTSYAFVETIDGGLRFIVYQSSLCLEEELNLQRGRYLVSIDLYWLAFILKFHPEILGWGKISPGKIMPWWEAPSEEEYNSYRKISQSREEQKDPNLPPLGILFLKGER